MNTTTLAVIASIEWHITTFPHLSEENIIMMVCQQLGVTYAYVHSFFL